MIRAGLIPDACEQEGRPGLRLKRTQVATWSQMFAKRVRAYKWLGYVIEGP